MRNFSYHLSAFGEKFQKKSGILELMDDLGNALSSGQMYMLGGGNPAHIPKVEKLFIMTSKKILKDKNLYKSLIGNYDPPQGNPSFLRSMAKLLQSRGLKITEKNIAITSGSQSAFFILFNLFAGKNSDGIHKHIILPYVPEYIGYAEQGIWDDTFRSFKPKIEFKGNDFFKYNIDFDNLSTEDAGAICISRPTNPSGNVISDEEVNKLFALAKKQNIPLIIDNAYGNPFPGIIFSETNLQWEPGMILVMSLSKLGLPGTRTGIVIAEEEIIQLVTNANAIISLANNNMGQAIADALIRSDKMIKLVNEDIIPFYRKKSKKAISLLQRELKGINYKIHISEGAFFLWLWLPDLGITSLQLYQALKKEKVIVVPGEFFFAGLDENWKHVTQCIRISFAQDEKIIEEGIKIIARTIKNIY